MKSLTEEITIVETQSPSFIEKARVMMEAAGDEAEKRMLAVEALCGDISKEISRIRRADMIEKLSEIANPPSTMSVAKWKQTIKTTVEDLADAEKKRLKEEGEGLGLQEGVDEMEALEFGIYEYKGRYWALGKFGKYEISNFTLKVLYHVKTSDVSAYRLLEIKNVYGKSAIMNLNTDDFVSLGAFKKVIARFGNYIFKGVDSDLGKLQEKLQRDERPTRLVQQLGWNKRGNFYAVANGIIPCPVEMPNHPQPLLGKEGSLQGADIGFIGTDEFGIITSEEENYFIPANSKIFEEKDTLFTNDKKFFFLNSTHCNFQSWSALNYRVYGEKAIIGQLFYLSALFRDIIYQAIGRRFPILNCYGQRGSGKGTFIESIMWLFGKPQDQIMLGGASTTVGFMRKFAQFSNAIVWLDEYKNNLPVKMIESLKNIYDGIGYERGKKDNSFETESTPISSACLLSGQQMPTVEPALFTRVIMLSFKPGKGFTEDDRREFKKLQQMQEQTLMHITANIVRHRTLFQQFYKEEFDSTFPDIIKKTNNKEIDERMMLNIAVLATTYKIAEKFLSLPYSYSVAENFLIENMKHQFTVLAGSDDIAKWWQVVENLFNRGEIKEDVDFELSNGYLFIRIQQVHPLYEIELRKRNDPHGLDKSTLENYISMDASIYVDKIKKRFPDGSNTWTHKFVYAPLNINLIKIVDAQQAKLKYDEMGVGELSEMEQKPTGGDGRQDDLPF